MGVGSDEAIDALLRCFCRPGIDKILVCPPTYGMYSVSAQVNDVGLVKVPLTAAPEFALDIPAINKALEEDKSIKLVYICSPGNPTASVIPKSQVEEVLAHPTYNGIVVLDEAYIDFAPPDSSCAELVAEYENLVVMQTLSKAFGLAGIRLGAAFCAPPVAALLNALKAPYNISSPTSVLAGNAVSEGGLKVMRENVAKIVEQRQRLVNELPKIPGVGRFRGGVASNFLLVEILNEQGKPDNFTALAVYERLAEKRGVVVRFRGKEFGCNGCLRITVGTEEECTRFIKELGDVIKEIQREHAAPAKDEEKKEKDQSGAIP